MQHLKCDVSREARARDTISTPESVASEIVNRYQPAGVVLDPCAGDGVFARHIPGCLTCEIHEGRDFFAFRQRVDWIVGNPPYSILNAWLDHSFNLADDIVYLLPIAKVFGSRKRLMAVRDYGGIVEVYAPWTGRACGFAFGWACGAVHFRHRYRGPMRLVI